MSDTLWNNKHYIKIMLLCLMLFQALLLLFFTLAKTWWNILGTFTFMQWLNMFLGCFFFFFGCSHITFKQTKTFGTGRCQNLKRNVLKFQKLSKGGKCLATLQPHLYPVNKASLFHAVCLWPDVCSLCECMCMSEPQSVCDLLLLQHSPPFCLLVNCPGEGGYNSRLRSVINLNTSYLCLPLQGEACPVTNMINPLPLCWQPPAHIP